jgi:hypothetical protein
MNSPVPRRGPAAGADPAPAAPAAGLPAARRLIAALLLVTAALDLSRCGLVLATPRHPAAVAGLAAGLTTAVLSAWTARGCLGRRRWPTWAAMLIGAASAPQAAASGFQGLYTIPDTATAALGILLAVTVLATTGNTGQPGQHAEDPCAPGKKVTP